MNEPQKNGNGKNNGESRIRRILFNEFSLIAAVIGAAWTVYSLFASPTHANEVEIAVLKSQMEGLLSLPGKVDDLKNEVTSLRTTIEERLPKK